MTYVRCTTLSLKVDYIAVTSSLRLEDALTRAKLIFAQGIQYIMAAVAEDGVCCSNTRCSIFDKIMQCSSSMIEIPPVLLQSGHAWEKG